MEYDNIDNIENIAQVDNPEKPKRTAADLVKDLASKHGAKP